MVERGGTCLSHPVAHYLLFVWFCCCGGLLTLGKLWSRKHQPQVVDSISVMPKMVRLISEMVFAIDCMDQSGVLVHADGLLCRR